MFWKKENTEMKKHDKTVLLFVFSKKNTNDRMLLLGVFLKKNNRRTNSNIIVFWKRKNEKQILLFASVAGYTPSLVENDK